MGGGINKNDYRLLLKKAYGLAFHKHVLKDKSVDMRNYSPLPNQPFWTHLMNVHNYLIIWGEKDPDVLLAAILHDVVEDSDVTTDYLEKEFSYKTAYLVKLLSKTKPSDDMTKKEFDEYFKNISTSKEAAKIKVMDRIDNLLTHSMYRNNNARVKSTLQETKKYFLKLARIAGMEKELKNAIKMLNTALKLENNNT